MPATISRALSFVAGSASGDMAAPPDISTVFSVEDSLFSSGTMAFQGDVATVTAAECSVPRFLQPHHGERGEAGGRLRHAPAAPGIDPQMVPCRRSRFLLPMSLRSAMFWNSVSAANCKPFSSSARVAAFRPFGSADFTSGLTPCWNIATPHRSRTAAPKRDLNRPPRIASGPACEPGRVFVLTEDGAPSRSFAFASHGRNQYAGAVYSDRVADPSADQGLAIPSSDGGECCLISTPRPSCRKTTSVSPTACESCSSANSPQPYHDP